MSVRIERVQQDLKRALSSVFIKNNLQHAAIKNIYVSKDLRGAIVEISSLDSTFTDDELVEHLKKRTPFIKRMLRSYINWKYFPDIRFVADEHKKRIESAHKVLEILAIDSMKTEDMTEE